MCQTENNFVKILCFVYEIEIFAFPLSLSFSTHKSRKSYSRWMKASE